MVLHANIRYLADIIMFFYEYKWQDGPFLFVLKKERKVFFFEQR